MDPAAQPASVLLEFVTWFVWWALYMVLQRRVCRRYPGLRTVCRAISLWTLVVAVAPGLWALLSHTVHGPRLVALFNHAFGQGVFAQMALRSLLMVPWLAGPGSEYGGGVPLPLGAERYALATLLALTQVVFRQQEGLEPADRSEAG